MDNMTKKITIIGIGAVVITAIISIAQTVVKIVQWYLLILISKLNCKY